MDIGYMPPKKINQHCKIQAYNDKLALKEIASNLNKNIPTTLMDTNVSLDSTLFLSRDDNDSENHIPNILTENIKINRKEINNNNNNNNNNTPDVNKFNTTSNAFHDVDTNENLTLQLDADYVVVEEDECDLNIGDKLSASLENIPLDDLHLIIDTSTIVTISNTTSNNEKNLVSSKKVLDFTEEITKVKCSIAENINEPVGDGIKTIDSSNIVTILNTTSNSEKNLVSSKKDFTEEITKLKCSIAENIIEPIGDGIKDCANKIVNKRSNVYKKYPCYYCGKLLTTISTHYIHKHSDEVIIQQFKGTKGSKRVKNKKLDEMQMDRNEIFISKVSLTRIAFF